MKKLQEFTDSLTKIKHTIYEFENGIKLLHAQNPSSIDYVLTVIVRAGSSFETINDVPHGTAHFLEHIISGNPNKLLKSKFEIDEFESGNKDEPEIYSNASTAQKYMYFYSYGNEEGSNRINQRIRSILDYPIENISKYIEKERKVILAEQSHENKEEHDRFLQFNRFLYEENECGFTHAIIGEKKSIEKISVEDISNFFEKQFVPENILITLQTGDELLPSHIDEIQEIVNIYPKETKERITPPRLIPLNKRIHHYKDEQMEGVSIAILMIQDYQKKLDYKSEVLEYLFRSLVSKVSFDYLREKQGLIYSAQVSSNAGLSFKQRILGYEVVTQPKNFKKVLEGIEQLISKEIKKFVESKEGRIWFESMISLYIFPRTMPYKTSYAEVKGIALIEGREIFELDKAIPQALKINIKDVYDFTQEFFNNIPIFWIESDTNGETLIKILQESKLYNRFKDGNI